MMTLKYRYLLLTAWMGFNVHNSVLAQEKPAFLVSEVTYKDQDLYTKEYGPKIRDLYGKYGCTIIAGGNNLVSVSNFDKKPDRIVIAKCESFSKAKTYVDSAERAALGPLKDRAATIRAYIIEGN